ncbi:hypothetical protein Rsub_02662 [Raphidocelis subcapitata]|uniref:Uncharacterized protein n=1 Tax=Raphidocelis subcapitata TaxID=307507 RepID=A0A2V0NQL1_9CHLO|nr:hypothetical protein Rsub_02662 [Raphidocelis subcapitata]|eukprot:GBF89958.1 hypothetical protein Rsub_02662 [Raphidocelis subcapitata]
MRLLLGAFAVLLAASAVTATVILPQPQRKWQASNCESPINQVTCKVNPNGNLEGLWYGTWGANSGFTSAPFIKGEGNFWYTQNWCAGFGLIAKCANGNPARAAAGFTHKEISFTNSYDAATQTATAEYLTGVKICYGEKTIKGITFTKQAYTLKWEASAGNPPQAVVVPTGAATTDSCGTTSNCKISTNFDAKNGKVIGGLGAKCKFTQGWFKYVQTGLYHSRYFMEEIKSVCTVLPMPYPTGKFIPCPSCAGNPNAPGCPDIDTFACPADCKK